MGMCQTISEFSFVRIVDDCQLLLLEKYERNGIELSR